MEYIAVTGPTPSELDGQDPKTVLAVVAPEQPNNHGDAAWHRHHRRRRSNRFETGS